MILIDIPLPDNCLECPLQDGDYGCCNANRNIDTDIYERPRSCSIIGERKKGKWIPQDRNKHYGMTSTAVYYFPKCSVCGGNANYTNFCPNCGADMTNS